MECGLENAGLVMNVESVSIPKNAIMSSFSCVVGLSAGMVKREPKLAGYFSSYGAGVLRVTETIPAKTQKVALRMVTIHPESPNLHLVNTLRRPDIV